MKNTLIALAMVVSAASSHALTVTQTVTLPGTSAGTAFTFNQFDSTLGTLTGVNFTVVSSTDTGSFLVTNNAAISSLIVKDPQDSLIITDNQASGGDYNLALGTTASLTSNPDANSATTSGAGFTIPAQSNQTFTLTGTNDLIVPASTTSFDLSGFLSAYTGAGTVSFTAYTGALVNLTGSNSSFDMTPVVNSTTLTLVYTYTAPTPPPPVDPPVVPPTCDDKDDDGSHSGSYEGEEKCEGSKSEGKKSEGKKSEGKKSEGKKSEDKKSEGKKKSDDKNCR